MSLRSPNVTQHSFESKISPSDLPFNTRILIIIACLMQGAYSTYAAISAL